MPNLFKIDYEAITREKAIWDANHRGMRPFFIVSEKTLKIIEADNLQMNFLLVKSEDIVRQIMGMDVAVCNSLGLGEFKVR